MGDGDQLVISKTTAEFLLWLVNQQQPNAGAPDFREACAQIMRAQDELGQIIEQTDPASEPDPALK